MGNNISLAKKVCKLASSLPAAGSKSLRAAGWGLPARQQCQTPLSRRTRIPLPVTSAAAAAAVPAGDQGPSAVSRPDTEVCQPPAIYQRVRAFIIRSFPQQQAEPHRRQASGVAYDKQKRKAIHILHCEPERRHCIVSMHQGMCNGKRLRV